MKLIQTAHALTKGDAASNQIIAMDAAFKELGYDTEIYANKIDEVFSDKAQHFSKLCPSKDNIVIYHMTTGTSFTDSILNYPYPVVLYYHNITPARYFFGNAWGSFFKCLKGRYQIRQLKKKVFFAWAASDYSRLELEQMDFKHTAVLPIILDYDEYLKTPVNRDIVEKLADGRLNILVVGRVTPHKKQDEAIKLVHYYKENISPQVRLIIVGNPKSGYGKKLHSMIERLGLEDNVALTGKVSFADLCTYYRACDLLLSLSEHEGFCVPLVEAMLFDKPVFAYAAAAVPQTLGDAGVLFAHKDERYMAESIYKIMSEPKELEQLAGARQKKLQEYSRDKLIKSMAVDLEKIFRLWKEWR